MGLGGRENVLFKVKTTQSDKEMDMGQQKELLESLDPEDFKYKA